MRSLLNASLLLLAAPIAVLSAPIPVLPRQDASSLPADTLELLSSSEGQSVLEAFMQWQAWQAAQSASDAAAGQEGSDLASSESSTDSPADGTSSDVASTEPIPGADDGSDNASASLDDTGAGRQPLPGDALHAHDIPVGAHPLADAAGDAWDMALVHHGMHARIPAILFRIPLAICLSCCSTHERRVHCSHAHREKILGDSLRIRACPCALAGTTGSVRLPRHACGTASNRARLLSHPRHS